MIHIQTLLCIVWCKILKFPPPPAIAEILVQYLVWEPLFFSTAFTLSLWKINERHLFHARGSDEWHHVVIASSASRATKSCTLSNWRDRWASSSIITFYIDIFVFCLFSNFSCVTGSVFKTKMEISRFPKQSKAHWFVI